MATLHHLKKKGKNLRKWVFVQLRDFPLLTFVKIAQDILQNLYNSVYKSECSLFNTFKVAILTQVALISLMKSVLVSQSPFQALRTHFE